MTALRTVKIGAVGGWLLALGNGVVAAGDLTPPAGPIGPTMKTLAQVEPRTAMGPLTTPGDADSMLRIGAPGSYYLTGDLLVAPGKRGIEIDADDVTVDLNGFRIGGFTGTLEGVAVVSQVNRVNITVKNGYVRNMGGVGVRLRPAFVYDARGSRAENLSVIDCGGDGIDVGENALVRECVVIDCVNQGIFAFSGSVIESCRVSGCSDGINVTGYSVVRACTVSGNEFAGIDSGSFCTIVECVASSNGHEGIIAHDGTVVSQCVAARNEWHGIVSYGRGSSILNCTASKNTKHGIRVAGRNLVKGNTCDENGYLAGEDLGANICSDGFGDRIEGNTCSRGDIGIQVLYDQNVIVGNTCMENTTNWKIAEGNVYGPIIDRRNLNSAAVNGNAAAGTMGSTDPNANFTF